MSHHIDDYPPARFLTPNGYVNAKVDNSIAYYPSMTITPLLITALVLLTPEMQAYRASPLANDWTLLPMLYILSAIPVVAIMVVSSELHNG